MTSTTTPLIYIATATALDEEMDARIEHHQSNRSNQWQLIEEPVELGQQLASLPQPSVVLVDCLTLWLNNCLSLNKSEWLKQKKRLFDVLRNNSHSLYFVSNEVGLGVIPMGKLNRDFVDEIGILHQELAVLANSVTMMIAGIPQTIK